MHALVDHFEECHVVVVDPYAQPFRGSPPAAGPSQQTPTPHHTHPSYFADGSAPTYHQGSFDPDDMELDLDSTSAPSSGSSSPPDTPISTPLSAYPQHAHASPYPGPVSAFDTTTVLPSRAGGSFQAARAPLLAPRAEDAFNAYAGYADYSSMLPGAGGVGEDSAFGAYRSCVTPALLLNSTTTSPADTPDSSRVASPVSYPSSSTAAPQPAPSQAQQPLSAAASSSAAAQVPRISTTLSRPATSLLLSKPFKCPKAACNKSYKQANGLKYHMTHGSCNFAPPKDLEQIQALLASKRSQKAAESGEPLSDAEMREVEKEAERRLRPYACGVGECQRRYKNMNGLRASSSPSLPFAFPY